MQIDFEHSCKDKKQYPTKRWALETVKNMELDNKTRMKWGVGTHKNMGKLNVYFCQFCGFWHIGHAEWRR